LRNAGLTLSKVHGDCNAPVTEQSPPPGTRHRKNTVVVLVTPGNRNRICFDAARVLIFSPVIGIRGLDKVVK
jgi:hypothetical protein